MRRKTNQRQIPVASFRSRAAVAGSAKLPLAYGGTEGGAENRYPQGKAEGFILRKK